MKAYIRDDFSSILEFRKWADALPLPPQWIKKFTDYQVQQDLKKGVFGKSNLEEIKAGITKFNHIDLIERLESEIEGSVSTTSPNEIPKRNLAYNDLGLGVFSFDLAAQGMYQLREFYSPKHQVVFDQDEVVETSSGYQLRADHSPIIHRLEEREGGKPRVRTTTKKVFAYFPKSKRQRQAAEIYVSCGNYTNVSIKSFLYSGMVAIIVAKKLIKASIPVRINTVIGWVNKNHQYCCAIIPVKDYNEPLDENLVAVATSDPRFWRHEGFKAILKLQASFGIATGGAGIVGSDLKSVLEMANYRLDVPNRFYYGRVEGEYEAKQKINQAIKQISESLSK